MFISNVSIGFYFKEDRGVHSVGETGSRKRMRGEVEDRKSVV